MKNPIALPFLAHPSATIEFMENTILHRRAKKTLKFYIT
jgi:hypothetical protein